MYMHTSKSSDEQRNIEQTLTALLDAGDFSKAFKMANTHPIAKNHLDEIFNNARNNPEEKIFFDDFLKQVMQEAIEKRDLEPFKYLQKMNIPLFSESISLLQQNLIDYDYALNKKLIFQNALSDLYVDAPQKSFIEQKMQTQLHDLEVKLNFEIKVAEENHKPLLILIGDFHHSISSTLLETQIIQLTSDPSIHNFFTESRSAQHYKDLGYNNENHWPKILFLDKVITPLQLTQTPIDSASYDCFDNNNVEAQNNCRTYVQSDDGIAARDTVMANHMIEKLSGNAIAIVGESHLKGLIQDTDLSKHYHIFPVATKENKEYCHQSSLKIYDQFTCSDKVMKFNTVRDWNEHHLAPKMLYEEANKSFLDYKAVISNGESLFNAPEVTQNAISSEHSRTSTPPPPIIPSTEVHPEV